MRVQPYGNSDGSDKGDYHRKWEAAINSKKKKSKIYGAIIQAEMFIALCVPPKLPEDVMFCYLSAILVKFNLIYAS